MNPLQQLHHAGQSIWLDNITRELLTSRTLARYINDIAVTGLTSNPTIFGNAFKSSDAYDESIAQYLEEGLSGEDLFFQIAIDDLREAADLFRPIWERTHGVDGWVSLEVSPLLAHDTESTLKAAVQLHVKADRPNLFIKIPGTPEGIPAIEEAVFAGVPVNVTLLFDDGHYSATADAYMRAIERRVDEGLDPFVGSVASVFVSRWDTAVAGKDEGLHNMLGIAMAKKTYKAYREVLDSARWQRLETEGAKAQRLLWASTGVKDPDASDVLYDRALAAPFTINTMPEKTLLAYGDHGDLGELMPADGGNADEVIQRFRDEDGVDVKALAEQLQAEGAEAFDKSWNELMAGIEEKSKAVAAAG
jgi:transaldolase